MSPYIIVQLSSFPNLHRISWSSSYRGLSHDSFIFQIAATQLGSVLSPCNIVEVHLGVDIVDYGPAAIYCNHIDEALTSDNYPFLCSVQLFTRIPFHYFPRFQSRGILRVAETTESKISFWFSPKIGVLNILIAIA